MGFLRGQFTVRGENPRQAGEGLWWFRAPVRVLVRNGESLGRVADANNYFRRLLGAAIFVRTPVRELLED